MMDDYTHYDKANKLLRLFQSLEAADRQPVVGPASREEERWHRLLIDVIYYFGLAISEERPEKGKPIDAYIERLIETLRRLERMPDHDRTIIVRAKEQFFTGKRTAAQNDYTIFFGRIALDLKSADDMARRIGPAASRWRTRLSIACERIARYQIRTLSFEIPRQSPADIRRMRYSLHILSAFHRALQSKVPIYYYDGHVERPIVIITDANGQPNPNLTLLAALNHLEPELLRGFVRSVDDWIRLPRTEVLGKFFSGIYTTLFGIRRIIENLQLPPFEINNIHYLMLERLHNILSREKAEVLRIVEEKAEADPEEGARIMESIYGGDFDRIDAQTVAQRLLAASPLVEAMEEDWTLQDTFIEVREHIRKRLGTLSDDVLDSIEISGNQISINLVPKKTDTAETPIRGHLSGTLVSMLRKLKARSATRRKIKALMNGPVSFDAADYRNIAGEFGIDEASSERLTGLIAGCFDDAGHFRRSYFVDRIEEFTEFEKIVVDFLWHYLSEIIDREDRLAFLNALQHLTARLHQPKKIALKMAAEFFSYPDRIRFSDRNALMLTTLLTRTYNQDLHIDTEITPEDVLKVFEGINPEVTEALRRWMEARPKPVFDKFHTTERRLSKALDQKATDTGNKPGPEMPLAFILALQREALICLGLIGGETAGSIIRTALLELGDPDAPVHHQKNSDSVRLQLIMLMQTAVRALGRACEPEDIPLLKSIRRRETEFIQFQKSDEHYTKRVHGAMEWIDKIVHQIESLSGT